MGSYYGEWFGGINGATLSECTQGFDVMRGVIAATNYSLTATWMNALYPVGTRGFDWRTDRFLMGFHYGSALEDTFSVNVGASCRTTVILGDPMLRAHILPPVTGLTASKAGSNVTVSWTGNTNATHGYRILRAASANPTGWQFLTEVGPGTSSWVHAASNPSTNIYLVKPLSLKTTGPGSYTNAGLGVFSTTITIP